MSAQIYYKQCILQKLGKIQVAWIPEVYAHKDNYVIIKGDDGWQIIMVGQARLSNGEVSEQSQDYKHQRKASDI